MISWMQKHRKYLVITIWISTIAFVGAGFVGWGAYKFGSSSNAVAKVGETEITIKELQDRYTRLYNYYNQLLKGSFDAQKAKEVGLEKLALNELIQEALLINYAKEHGLIVTDEEVARKISSISAFYDKNNRFSKKIYLEVLKNNHIKPKDFEENIRKELLIEKLNQALLPKLFSLEKDTISSALFIGDKIKYKLLTDQNIEVNVTKESLKEYFNNNKKNYLTPKKYKIALIKLNPEDAVKIEEKELKEFYESNKIKYKSDEGKILPFKEAKELVKRDYLIKKGKKEALKKYVAFKKGKTKADEEITIESNSTLLPKTLISKLENAKEGSVLKPKLYQQNYLIVKLIKKEPPRPINFEEAKDIIKKDFIAFKKEQLLIKKAKEMVKNGFNGDITKEYICRDDVDKIKNLDKFDAAKFLKELFLSDKKSSFIQIDKNKVVLYDVLDQKLKMKNKVAKYKDLIENNAIKLKAKLQSDKLIQKLQRIYPIKIYKGI